MTAGADGPRMGWRGVLLEGPGWCGAAGTRLTRATLAGLLGYAMLTLESSGVLVLGWNWECQMDAPLVVHILTLAGPGPPLLVSVLILLEAGRIFAN